MTEVTDSPARTQEGFSEPQPKTIVFEEIHTYKDPSYRPPGELDSIATKVDAAPVWDGGWVLRFARLREMGERMVAQAVSVDKERKKVTLRFVGTIGGYKNKPGEESVTVKVNTNDTAFRGYNLLLGEQDYVELPRLKDRPEPRTFSQIDEGEVIFIEPVATRKSNVRAKMIMWQDADILSFPEGVDPLNPFPKPPAE